MRFVKKYIIIFLYVVEAGSNKGDIFTKDTISYLLLHSSAAKIKKYC